VDVNGVGYEVNMTATDLSHLPATGEPVLIHTWYLGREDGVQLFGFLQADSRSLFKLLLGIGGIGPRSALAILSGLSRSELEQAVVNQDARMLSRLPGIGRKTADRLLLELKDKLKIPAAPPEAGAGPAAGAWAEALEALLALGYPATQARLALQKIRETDLPAQDPGQDRVAQIVRQALKQL